ncbi:MAG TPA: hypothetical protein VF572_02215 [Candidatus Saccharimonadales bacterium]|jgi:hypothetical protein
MTNPEANHNFVPPLEEVTTAYQDILAHNKAHTGFGSVFRAVFEATNSHGEVFVGDEVVKLASATEPVSGDHITDAMNERVAEGEMDAELQDIFHDNTFMRVGVKLAPIGGHVGAGNRRATSSALVPTVENADLFTGFLSGLDGEQVQADDDNLKLIGDVVSGLKDAVTIPYTREAKDMSPEDRQLLMEYSENALRTFVAIEPEFERLGIDKPDNYQKYLENYDPKAKDEEWWRWQHADKYTRDYDTMQDYVKYWGKDVLPEFIEIGPPERAFVSPDYYFDGMQRHLEEKVHDVIGLIGPERTTEYGMECVQGMLQGIETALASGNADPDQWWVSDDNRKLLEAQAERLKSVIV